MVFWVAQAGREAAIQNTAVGSHTVNAADLLEYDGRLAARVVKKVKSVQSKNPQNKKRQAGFKPVAGVASILRSLVRIQQPVVPVLVCAAAPGSRAGCQILKKIGHGSINAPVAHVMIETSLLLENLVFAFVLEMEARPCSLFFIPDDIDNHKTCLLSKDQR
jgi:hypothetical protein